MHKPKTGLILCCVLFILLYVFCEVPIIRKEFLLNSGDAFRVHRWTPTGLAQFNFQLKEITHSVIDGQLKTTYVILVTAHKPRSKPVQKEIKITNAETTRIQEWKISAKRDPLAIQTSIVVVSNCFSFF